MNTPSRTNLYYVLALLALGAAIVGITVCAIAGIPSHEYWEGTS